VLYARAGVEIYALTDVQFKVRRKEDTMKRSWLAIPVGLTITGLLLSLAWVARVDAQAENPRAMAPVANHYNLVAGPEGGLYFIDTATGRTWHGAFHKPGENERGYVWHEINTPVTNPPENGSPSQGPRTDARGGVRLPNAAAPAKTVKHLEKP
jgi:hypothetical protein